GGGGEPGRDVAEGERLLEDEVGRQGVVQLRGLRLHRLERNGSVTTGSNAYSTSMSPTASSAVYRSTAPTAATASPAYRTLSTASAYCTTGSAQNAGSGFDKSLASSPVITAKTSGRARARLVSTSTLRPL